MEKLTIKTILGNYDYEIITKGNKDYVVTISKTDGDRYLKASEVPAPILAFLRKAHFKIRLYDADALNNALGLRK